jgi:hypothetical protein
MINSAHLAGWHLGHAQRVVHGDVVDPGSSSGTRACMQQQRISSASAAHGHYTCSAPPPHVGGELLLGGMTDRWLAGRRGAVYINSMHWLTTRQHRSPGSARPAGWARSTGARTGTRCHAARGLSERSARGYGELSLLSSCTTRSTQQLTSTGHRDRQHLPCGSFGQRAFRDKRRGEIQHGAITHHHPGIASEGNRNFLKAGF